MAIHLLTPRKVQTAKPGKYEDGGGLRLVVSKTGARKWVVRYTIKKRRREMGLGSFPDVSLSEAREKATECRRMASEGIDPIEEKRVEEEVIPTFTSCAARYIRSHRAGWSNRKHTKQWISTLKTYVIPKIGNKKVDEIVTQDILAILNPIWNTKTETAKRVQGRIENVLDYATAFQYRDTLNPARWRGHLDKLLPRPSRVTTVKHHPAMPYDEVKGFMAELSQKNSISSYALRMLILTATRTNEVVNAKWSEINLKEGAWIIPANRMKAKREHRVPLSSEVMAILDKVPKEPGNPYIFIGLRQGQPICSMAMIVLMRKMEYGHSGTRGHYVPHGFRSSFRDWSGEVSSFPRDVAEMALAHTIGNKVEAAYRRGDLFEKRRKMMQAWADYVSIGNHG